MDVTGCEEVLLASILTSILKNKQTRSLLRFIYSLLFYLAFPYLFLRLIWRSRLLPDYRRRLPERLGFYPFTLKESIWIHAVSVGETIAAIPLIKALQAQYPNLPIVVTTMTPTGAARVKAGLGDSVIHAYLPYDFLGATQRFLKTIKPVIGIIMETELWPNLLAACRKKQIPVCLVNARLSEKSAQGYRRINSLVKEMLSGMQIIAAQGEADAKRFIALGALHDRMKVTGNIKFDLQLPHNLSEESEALRKSLGPNRFVWIAASTHDGEEEIVLAAHQKLREKNSNALLILVPRHPDRFDVVAKECEKKGFVIARRSIKAPCTTDTAIYFADTMGELLLLYGGADVAFVGGSLIERGGHNILEPGALSKPILTGPSCFNFAEISELFLKANALTTIHDTTTLADQLILFSENLNMRNEMGQRARQVVEANRGALDKQLGLIQNCFKA